MITIPNNALVLMIGPSGAGKSTIATNNFHASEILESDGVRIELFGTKEKGDLPNELFFNKVFAVIHTRANNAIKSGRRVVIDATNLKAADRKVYTSYAIQFKRPIFYIVFDRPLEDKMLTQGWRKNQIICGKPLVEFHDEIFHRNEDVIMSGDNGIATVIDARIDTFLVEPINEKVM